MVEGTLAVLLYIQRCSTYAASGTYHSRPATGGALDPCAYHRLPK